MLLNHLNFKILLNRKLPNGKLPNGKLPNGNCQMGIAKWEYCQMGHILRQRQKDMPNLRLLENGNNAINSGLVIKNEDEYLKSLLGTADAPPAY